MAAALKVDTSGAGLPLPSTDLLDTIAEEPELERLVSSPPKLKTADPVIVIEDEPAIDDDESEAELDEPDKKKKNIEGSHNMMPA